MKKCPWCGCEYSGEVSVCAIDQYPLDSGAPYRSAFADKLDTPASELPEKPLHFSILFLTYIVAIAVSCFASYVVFFCGLALSMILDGTAGFVVLFGAVGFCGVFSGAMCLPRSSRRFGSIFLLILGTVYYIYVQAKLDAETSFPLVWLIPLAGGGMTAIFVLSKRSFNKIQQATTVPSPCRD